MANPNRVRERRENLGLSQVDLAAAVGIARQSIGAIEAGRAVPGVDVALRIGKALDASVDDLFAQASGEAAIEVEPAVSAGNGRVALAHIAGRWVAHPLLGANVACSADGLLNRRARGISAVEPVRPLREARDNVVILGCAMALGLLADRLNSRTGPGRFLWFPSSSTSALEALAERRTHIAGVHLIDGATGQANVVDVKRYAGKAPLVLIALGAWEAGLVTARGNPKALRGAGDLGRRGLKLVTRERGSGARRLFDQVLADAGSAPRGASTFEARGHLEVAHAVALGAADAGIATRDAAIAFGLHFQPLREERYDLCLAEDELHDPRIARLLEVMTSAHFRRELSALGYDVGACGKRIAEIHAA